MELTSLNNNRGRKKQTITIDSVLYGKVPPQSVELEKAILGAILLDPNCLPDVLNILFSEIFYIEAHQIIYSSIVSLYDSNQKVDILTVVEQLKKKESLDTVGGPYYITTLTDRVVYYAKK